MVHNFENSILHEREQTKKADDFYKQVLHVSEIKRFNTNSNADMEMQREDVDLIVTLNEINYRISEKFRDKDYGDIYVEIYSKYPKTKGWMYTGSANAILYFTPIAVYWITHKSLSEFCFQTLFPIIPNIWFEELYLSGKTIVSKSVMLKGKLIKINLIQAHNQPNNGKKWETIGISIPLLLLEKNGVKIKKFER